jgi:hypothetical protein
MLASPSMSITSLSGWATCAPHRGRQTKAHCAHAGRQPLTRPLENEQRGLHLVLADAGVDDALPRAKVIDLLMM